MDTKQNKCKTEIFSRVTGFFRPTREWNPGKVEEFKDRKGYDLTERGKTVKAPEGAK